MPQQHSTASAYLKAIYAAMALTIVPAVGGPAAAIDLYATSIGGSQIDKVDTVTNSVSLYSLLRPRPIASCSITISA